MYSEVDKFAQVFRRACISAYKDNVFGIAKGAAYSGLLSFFPLLTTITAILVQANAVRVSNVLTDLLFEAVPPGTQDIIRTNLIERGARPVFLLITGTVISLYAASGVMMSLMEGFRMAYHIPKNRTFWAQRGMAALLVFTAALPLIAASALMLFGQQIERMVMHSLGFVRGGVIFVGTVIRYFVTLAAIVASIGSLYYLAPNHPDKRSRNVWPGATLATILWLLATIIFGWYVKNIANYNVTYGSIAAVIALLVWMYVLSVVALIGCEFNAELDRLQFEEFPA